MGELAEILLRLLGISGGAAAGARLVPLLAAGARPVVKGAVQAGLAAGDALRSAADQAGEEVEDLMAEARAERANPAGEAATAPKRPARGKAATAPKEQPIPVAHSMEEATAPAEAPSPGG